LRHCWSCSAGIALAVLPAVTTAYATVEREHLPDATAQINILQRLGGAIGGSLFVALLGTTTGHSVTLSNFHTVFAYFAGATILALTAAIWLAVTYLRVPETRFGRSGLVWARSSIGCLAPPRAGGIALPIGCGERGGNTRLAS
jgi:hypothetical protein